MSLANIYRPSVFGEVIGQTFIVSILEHQIKTDTISHTYLFTGPAGTGKTSCARLFAAEINGSRLGTFELDAASNNGVADVRQIIEDCKLAPLTTKYKIYIIDECHMLSIGAWNAFLKLLEEPPQTAIFLLCTTDPQKIPGTILSRVQSFHFKKVAVNLIYDKLCDIYKKETSKDVEQPVSEALRFIANKANGGVRDSITMLDKVLSSNLPVDVDTVCNILGISNYEYAYKTITSILNTDEKQLAEVMRSVRGEGLNVKDFLGTVVEMCLDFLKLQCAGEQFCTTPLSWIKLFKKDFANEDVSGCITTLLEKALNLEATSRYNSNPALTVEASFELLLLNFRQVD